MVRGMQFCELVDHQNNCLYMIAAWLYAVPCGSAVERLPCSRVTLEIRQSGSTLWTAGAHSRTLMPFAD